MQYLLTEEEYKELTDRPSKEDHLNLVDNLRRIAMKAAGLDELPCGKGYCDKCIFSGNFALYTGGSYAYKHICPIPERRDFSK